MGVHVVAIVECDGVCATLHFSPSGCAASSGNRWQPVKSVDVRSTSAAGAWLPVRKHRKIFINWDH
jgi:hypothetical protein